ncbi:MAG TPA: phosphoglucosamine mutase [Bacteroidales bacterium]|nr:phosphoglucosamine mutase [Bacteroidales bacterium]
MALIKSISGIRGTIGGYPGEGLSPVDIVRFTSAFGDWIKSGKSGEPIHIVTGRDARTSGDMITRLVTATLNGQGINVIDLGLASTPTVEIAVASEKADGGIIISASHNPGNWNALKLLNRNGELLSSSEGRNILDIADAGKFNYCGADETGSVKSASGYEDKHIEMIKSLPAVNTKAISESGFKVVIDCVNSVGGIIIPKLLRSLGVSDIIELYSDPTGIFPHNPEPLPENLDDLIRCVKESDADVGFVVDPDVDRLAMVCEDGSLFNEEYTLVACADYILSLNPGNTVSNISSTRALRDVTNVYGGKWYSSAVGEVNVVEKMKEVDAVIGGEGNGGIIYPPLHYGRDAVMGIALFLSHLASSGMRCSELRFKYPHYVISKNKINLLEDCDPDELLKQINNKLGVKVTDRRDGLLMETGNGWVHLRKSNTEPILRVYSEGPDDQSAETLASEIIKIVKKFN